MNSSTSPTTVATRTAGASWAPPLDLSTEGLARLDPRRIEEAVADGYQAGLAAGQAEALARGAAQTEAAIGELRDQATQLFRRLDGVRAELEQVTDTVADDFAARVVDAAMQIAAAVVGRELRDPTDAARDALRRAVAGLDLRRDITVRLHPDDLALVDGSTLPPAVALTADASIERGGAVAETDHRTVDARISTALHRAQQVLEGLT